MELLAEILGKLTDAQVEAVRAAKAKRDGKYGSRVVALQEAREALSAAIRLIDKELGS